ncbi:MAG: membrane protein insertion efficiency factor YidD [Cyclobacteriaceae bacterium]
MFGSSLCWAQLPKIDLSNDLKVSDHKHVVNYGKYFERADNELELVYTTLFVGYKKFISSQDGSNCSFTPSCSEYAVEAVDVHGVLKGGLMFFDRYSRCNSLSPQLYEKDMVKRRLIDDVGEY